MRRLEPDASVIVTGARWHNDDLIGRVLERGKKTGRKWQVVRFPALAEPGDVLGRQPGDALWPERFNRETLERIRSETDTWTWNGLYQQAPSPDEGSVFSSKTFRYYTVHEGYYCLGAQRIPIESAARFLLCDLALSERETACFSVNGAFDVVRIDGKEHLIMVDWWRDRKQAPDVKARIWAMYRQHGPHRLRFQAIEDKHYGSALCQELPREGMVVREVKADADKVTRAQAATVLFDQGRVWFPEDRGNPYLSGLEGELLSFPAGTYDDQVDVIAYACNLVIRGGIMVAVGGPSVTVQRTGIDGYAAPHRPQGNRPPWA
jgi:predicted phage terminase large subunit-like protein